MKYYKCLILLVIISGFFSCKSLNTTNFRQTGEISLPDPDVKFVITLTNENIQTLGEIDIVKEYSSVNKDIKFSIEQQEIIENIGTIFNEEMINISKINALSSRKTIEEKIVRELIYDTISLYPDMDYILFPKYEISKQTITGMSDVLTQTVRIRLRGKAVKIKL